MDVNPIDQSPVDKDKETEIAKEEEVKTLETVDEGAEGNPAKEEVEVKPVESVVNDNDNEIKEEVKSAEPIDIGTEATNEEVEVKPVVHDKENEKEEEVKPIEPVNGTESKEEEVKSIEPVNGTDVAKEKEEREKNFILNFVKTVTTSSKFKDPSILFRCVDAALLYSPTVFTAMTLLDIIPPFLHGVSKVVAHSDQIRKLFQQYDTILRQYKAKIVQEKLEKAALTQHDLVQHVLVELSYDHYKTFEIGFNSILIAHDHDRAIRLASTDLAQDLVTQIVNENVPKNLYSSFVWVNDSNLKNFWRGLRWTFGSYDVRDGNNHKILFYDFYTKSIPVFRIENNLWVKKNLLEEVTIFLKNKNAAQKGEFSFELARLPFSNEVEAVKKIIQTSEFEENFLDITTPLCETGVTLEFFGPGIKSTKKNVEGRAQQIEEFTEDLITKMEEEKRQALKKLEELTTKVLGGLPIPSQFQHFEMKILENQLIQEDDFEDALRSIEVIVKSYVEEDEERLEKDKNIDQHLKNVHADKGTIYPETVKQLKEVRVQTAHELKNKWPTEIAKELLEFVEKTMEGMDKAGILQSIVEMEEKKLEKISPMAYKIIKFVLESSIDSECAKPLWFKYEERELLKDLPVETVEQLEEIKKTMEILSELNKKGNSANSEK